MHNALYSQKKLSNVWDCNIIELNFSNNWCKQIINDYARRRRKHVTKVLKYCIVNTGQKQNEMKYLGIGGKSYGTQEQCSQKLFELTENIRKISLF